MTEMKLQIGGLALEQLAKNPFQIDKKKLYDKKHQEIVKTIYDNYIYIIYLLLGGGNMIVK